MSAALDKALALLALHDALEDKVAADRLETDETLARLRGELDSSLEALRRAANSLIDELQDDQPPALPVISIEAPAAVLQENTEGSQLIRFDVLRTGSTEEPSLADWTKSGTTNAADFVADQPFAGSVLFAPGAAAAPIEFELLGDKVAEPTETITVTLSAPIGATIGERDAATLEIANAEYFQYASKLPWRSGFRMPHNTPAAHDAGQRMIAEWRGRKTDIGSTFMGADIYQSWTMLADNWVHDQLRGSVALGNTFWTVAVPLTCGSDHSKYVEGARGDFDAKHALNAKALRAAVGQRPIVIRLGWEADHGFPWTWVNKTRTMPNTPEMAATYKAFWDRIGAVYKTELPGTVLDFNVLRDTSRPLGTWAPPSADIYSVDVYDSFTDQFAVQDIKQWFGRYDPATGWAKGPRGVAEFAKAKGKMFAVPEWGVTNLAKTEASPANNGDFTRAMFNLFKEFKNILHHECYFEGGNSLTIHDICNQRSSFNSKATQAYLDCYRPK